MRQQYSKNARNSERVNFFRKSLIKNDLLGKVPSRYVKSQSAMEYLMTYGWAILIIAVVLGALFQLGVFSGIGTPRAQPGNCQVVKVGSGITQTISLEGECQGQQPEYVLQSNGQATTNVIFDVEYPATGVTVTAWINIPAYSGPNNYCGGAGTGSIFYNGAYDWANGQSWTFTIDNGYVEMQTPNMPGGGGTSNLRAPLNSWVFVAGTIEYATSSTSEYVLYLNSAEYGPFTANTAYANTDGVSYLGTGFACNPRGQFETFYGSISNVQVYNVTLSPSEVTALYQEGIGGAPIRPQNIMGWWPLNGNAQDYSGNNNNGQVSGGVTYSSSWTSGYTQP